jgi:uncharacterized Fe-S cluster protein YjdI
MKDIIKNYSNGELTIKWQQSKCIHSAVCLRELPKVYNPNERPWIKIENATTEELKAQVNKCPSGALSYYMNDNKNKEAESMKTKIEVMANGPLLVYGTLKVTDKEGNTEIKNKTTAFCRCGHSANKPYCDGAHIKNNFVG